MLLNWFWEYSSVKERSLLSSGLSTLAEQIPSPLNKTSRFSETGNLPQLNNSLLRSLFAFLCFVVWGAVISVFHERVYFWTPETKIAWFFVMIICWLLTSLSHSALLTSKISDISCPSILKKKKKKTSLFWQISGKAQDTSYIQRSPQLAGMFWDSNVFVGDGKSQVLSLQIHALDSNIRWKITGQIILYLTLYK